MHGQRLESNSSCTTNYAIETRARGQPEIAYRVLSNVVDGLVDVALLDENPISTIEGPLAETEAALGSGRIKRIHKADVMWFKLFEEGVDGG